MIRSTAVVALLTACSFLLVSLLNLRAILVKQREQAEILDIVHAVNNPHNNVIMKPLDEYLRYHDLPIMNNPQNNIIMKPLDEYLRYHELPIMNESECHRSSTLITNASLSYLLELPTPCVTGEEKCVIAFSLWCGGLRHGLGADVQCARYTSHLSNLHGWKAVFKGWEIRVYTDGSVGSQLLTPYQDIVNIITVNHSLRGDGTWGTMWRLLPIWDDSVDRFLTRDVDSVPLVRDWATAYEWIRLGNPSYRWGDHEHHYSHPILAGALGLTRHALTEAQRNKLYERFHGTIRIMSKYGDQEWYETYLWPLLNETMLSYDVVNCGRFLNSRPFPVPHSRCDWILGGPEKMFGERKYADCRHTNHSSWKWG
jgi:hypothetical protein